MGRACVSSLIFGLLAGAACTQPSEQTPPLTPPPSEDGVICLSDDDCPGEWICLGGLCSSFECESEEMCAEGEICKDGWCAEPPAQCASADDCPGDLICDGFTHSCINPEHEGCFSALDCLEAAGCEDGCDCAPDGSCVPTVSGGEVLDPIDGDPNDPNQASNVVDPETDPYTAPAGDLLDLGGYVVENREDTPPSQVTELPAGTSLAPGQVLIIGRDAERAEFEAAWGVTLGSDVAYLTTHATTNGVPIINSGERWALVDPAGDLADGITITGGKNKSYQRISPSDASADSSWQVLDDYDASPGSTSLPTAGVGLVISEWSDNHDAGMYPFEFIEIYYAP